MPISTKAKLEQEAHELGSHIGWMANVINCTQRRPVQRIRGLIALAKLGAVSSVPFSMEHILIDGKVVPWEELEKYQPRSPELTSLQEAYSQQA